MIQILSWRSSSSSSSSHNSRRTIVRCLFLLTSIWCVVSSSSPEVSSESVISTPKLRHDKEMIQQYNNNNKQTNTIGRKEKTLNRKLTSNVFKNNATTNNNNNNETATVEKGKEETNTTTTEEEKEVAEGELTPETGGDNPLNQTDPEIINNTNETTPIDTSETGSSNSDPNEPDPPTASPTIEKNCEASSCDGCKSLSGTASIQGKDKSCFWDERNGCVEISLKDISDPNSLDFICEDPLEGFIVNDPSSGMGEATTAEEEDFEDAKDTNDDGEEEEEDIDEETIKKSSMIFVLVFFVLLGGFVIRRMILGRCNEPDENTDGNDTSDVFGPSSGLSGRPNSEIVPLAGGDDWDWNDNNAGDVELSIANHPKEDLEMAMAMSLSENYNSDQNKKSMEKKSKPFLDSTNISPAPQTTIAPNDSWDDESGWDDDPEWDGDLPIQNTSNHKRNDLPPPPPPITPTTVVSPPKISKPPPAKMNNDDIQSYLRETGSQITSLGMKKAVPKPAVQQKNPVEDDIFASMGLSSFNDNKPKATTTSVQPLPSHYSHTFNSNTPSNALTTDVGVDDGSNWDDGDLDDLLND